MIFILTFVNFKVILAQENGTAALLYKPNLPSTLIVYSGDWHPTITWEDYLPQTKLSFYRILTASMLWNDYRIVSSACRVTTLLTQATFFLYYLADLFAVLPDYVLVGSNQESTRRRTKPSVILNFLMNFKG